MIAELPLPTGAGQRWPCGPECRHGRTLPGTYGEWLWCDHPAAGGCIVHAGHVDRHRRRRRRHHLAGARRASPSRARPSTELVPEGEHPIHQGVLGCEQGTGSVDGRRPEVLVRQRPRQLAQNQPRYRPRRPLVRPVRPALRAQLDQQGQKATQEKLAQQALWELTGLMVIKEIKAEHAITLIILRMHLQKQTNYCTGKLTVIGIVS